MGSINTFKPLSTMSNQRHWLTSARWTIFSVEKIWEPPGIKPRAAGSGSKYANHCADYKSSNKPKQKPKPRKSCYLIIQASASNQILANLSNEVGCSKFIKFWHRPVPFQPFVQKDGLWSRSGSGKRPPELNRWRRPSGQRASLPLWRWGFKSCKGFLWL